MTSYRNHICVLALALCLSALAAGVSHAMAASGGSGPSTVPGECYCAECGMAVKADSPFASQIIYRGGKTVWFCDLGDMMLHYDGIKDKGQVSAVYVRDYAAGGWTDGTKAFYLTGAKVRTPMRYGILAFPDRKAAEDFRAKSGGDKVVSFDEAISKGVFRE